MQLTPYGIGCALALLATLCGAAFWCWVQRTGYRSWITLAVLSAPLVLVTSRLVYVLGNIAYYVNALEKPQLMLCFWDGGFSMSGAFLGLLLAACLAAKLTGEPASTLLDAVGLGAPLGLIVERIAENGTGLGLGNAIQTEWMQELPFFCAETESGSIVHAVWRYEAVAAAIIFLVLIVWAMTAGRRSKPGDLLLLFMVIYGVSQTVLESLRNDGLLVVHFVRVQQVLAMVFVAAALAVWSARAIKLHRKPQVWWLVAVLGVALGVWQEFQIDSSENLWLDYGLLALGAAAVGFAALQARRLSMREVG